VVPTDLFDGEETALNTSHLNLFATKRNAVVLSEDGKVLTVWASVRWHTEYNYGILASFRQENGTWVLKDRQNDVITSPFRIQSSTFRLYMAESGGVVAVGLYSFDGEELMNVYEYNTPDKWSLVESFSEPPGQDFDSRFGQAGDISYDGSVIAVSAPNFEGKGRFRWGFVKVFEKEGAGAYKQRGQTIEPSAGCVTYKRMNSKVESGSNLAMPLLIRTEEIPRYNNCPYRQMDLELQSRGIIKLWFMSCNSHGSKLKLEFSCVHWIYNVQCRHLQYSSAPAMVAVLTTE
jgi:hypothetical protein